MAKKFRELRKAMRPEAQVRVHEKAKAIKAELRQVRYCFQEQLVAELEVEQATVTKIEKKAGM
ncbi:hypothetical protein DJ030_01325 [bacterium endosymbiont of Escarpia laminata]|nr:MAG: hypothetical protein DJ030_01325 [bacterium endosymbiont of Escarpia laminata]